MHTKPGVYALIFHLAATTTVAYTRGGKTYSFKPGWYVYVGSACGVGGLARRVARHARRLADGKKPHWHVDSLREHAELVEVWYGSTDDNAAEHAWMRSILALRGASVPVPGFGASDCTARCSAHLVHFTDRPLTAAFRARLERNDVSPSDVFVEWIDDDADLATCDATGLAKEYQIGRRHLESLRRTAADRGWLESQCRSLAKGRPARRVAEECAAELSTDYQTIKKAIELAKAVETLIGSCGDDAARAIFHAPVAQTRSAILRLARTADTRQLHRIDGVLDGRFRSLAPSPDDDVYDTVAFAEVPSRLARARGTLEKLAGEIAGRNVIEHRAYATLLAICYKAAIALRRETVAVRGRRVPPTLAKEVVWTVLRSRSLTGRTVGQVRGALRLTIKSLWDGPEMRHRGLRPTEKERERTLVEIERIAAAVDVALTVVNLHNGGGSASSAAA